MRIEAIEQVDQGLRMTFADSGVQTFSWRWLRDHSDDPASLDPDTLQRVVETFDIPRDLVAGSVKLSNDGSEVRLSWADGSGDTSCSADLLHHMLAGELDRSRTLWATGADAGDQPVFGYEQVMADDAALLEWLETVQRVGFGLVGQMPHVEPATSALAERIATPRSTVFGGIWRLASEMNEHQDSAYSTTFLEPHTDSTYMTDAPGTQLFCCLERTGTGGESILLDGFAIAENMRSTEPEAFETLTSVSVPGRYIEPGVHLKARRPPICLDDQGRVVQLSFNNYDRAPFWLPEPQMSEFYEAYSLLHEYIIDRSRWFEVRLDAGDALIFDNWRVLHGRQAYTGKRVFYGCYHNRDDVLSKLTVL